MKLNIFNPLLQDFYIIFDENIDTELGMYPSPNRSGNFSIHLYDVLLEKSNLIPSTVQNIRRCLLERQSQSERIIIVDRNTKEQYSYHQFLETFKE